jgi:mono/diheme cytochrome c family protein
MTEKTVTRPDPDPEELAPQPVLPTPPFWMVAAFLVLVVCTWLPLVFLARARVVKSADPRVHIIQDMDNQPRFGPQAYSQVFADKRASRPPIPGTVARGELFEDDHFYRGYTLAKSPDTGEWVATYFDGFPPGLGIDRELMQRGQSRFEIYCAPCHGIDGMGNGAVSIRATERGEPRWVPPSSLHGETVVQRESGHLFNTITNGIRNMAGYGPVIPVEDRWAIVLYIRALQRSQSSRFEDVPENLRGSLR